MGTVTTVALAALADEMRALESETFEIMDHTGHREEAKTACSCVTSAQ